MNLIENTIRELIWHEFGHFCLDLIKIKNNPNFKITSFKFEFNKANSYWRCSVTCKNPYITSNKEIVENLNRNELCFDIISIIAGSVFESVYRRKFYNQYYCPRKILNVGSARNDMQSINNILSELGNGILNTKIRDFILSNILDEFFDIIFKNDSFFDKAIEILEPIELKIISEFNIMFDYLYILKESEIISLSNQLENLISSSNILVEIEELKRKLYDFIFKEI